MRLKSRISHIGICFVFTISIFAACGRDKQDKPQKSAVRSSPVTEKGDREISETSVPKYTVLDAEVYDVPIKTQIETNVLVSKDISSQGLTVLLKHLYAETSGLGGFKYHKHPTHIVIRACTSKEHADSGMGQWIGMLSKIGDDAEPEITVKEQLLIELKKKPEEKFGLTEAKRRSIFSELFKATDRAEREANQKCPDLKPGDPGCFKTAFREQLKRWSSFSDSK